MNQEGEEKEKKIENENQNEEIIPEDLDIEEDLNTPNNQNEMNITISDEEIIENEQPKKNNKESVNDKPDKNISEMKLEDVLKINQNEINFGNVFPGQIIEETIIILNNMNQTKVHFKIKVNCLTPEFDELDEYVYSMRRPTQNEVFNYNDTFLILLAPKAISYYKLAIKVPNCKDEKSIDGNIVISSEATQTGDVIIPVHSKIVIPKLTCEKMIKLKRFDMPVIKLFLKNFRRQDYRITLKNITSYNCFGDLSILNNQNLEKLIDINCYPNQISMQANAANNFAIGIRGTVMDDQQLMNQEFRFVLLVKIRNSSIIFSYPVLLNTGDGNIQFQQFWNFLNQNLLKIIIVFYSYYFIVSLFRKTKKISQNITFQTLYQC